MLLRQVGVVLVADGSRQVVRGQAGGKKPEVKRALSAGARAQK
jgi:hypothetical protein